jgi:hypothetical protein
MDRDRGTADDRVQVDSERLDEQRVVQQPVHRGRRQDRLGRMAVERGLDGGEGMAALVGKYGPSTSSGFTSSSISVHPATTDAKGCGVDELKELTASKQRVRSAAITHGPRPAAASPIHAPGSYQTAAGRIRSRDRRTPRPP